MPDIKKISETMIRRGETAIMFPLRYDAMAQWVWDANGNHVLDIRGWGRLQYHPEGQDEAAKLQDEIGEWVVAALNAQYEQQTK